MTIQDEEIYNNSQNCWICKEDLDTDKVRELKKLKTYLFFFIIQKDMMDTSFLKN